MNLFDKKKMDSYTCRRIAVAIVLSLLSIVAHAQIKSSAGSTVANDAQVRITVRDSLSTDVLPGATVVLSSGKDTLRLVTDIRGMARYYIRDFKADPVSVSASFLGFKEKTGIITIDTRTNNTISIGLQEDPQQINAIIVKGDVMAMVMHGDTTIFNASAFPSMKGDQLRDLLNKIPGIKINEGSITYNGGKIDRLLLNGTNLFGKNIKDAMDMVLAEEVKSVKVYEKDSVEDLAADGIEAKERVMDVRTWRPLQRVGQITLEGDGGRYLSQDKNEQLYEGYASLGNFVLTSKPNITASITANHNSKQSLSPIDGGEAMISIGKDILHKGGYQAVLRSNYDKMKTNHEILEVFNHGALWEERRDSSSQSNLKQANSTSMTLSGYTMKGKTNLRSSANLSFNNNLGNIRNTSSSWQDAAWRGYDMSTLDTLKAVNGSASVSIDIKFKKARRQLSITPSASFTTQNGGGSRIDTLTNSISREWFSTTTAIRTSNPKIQLTWTEPLGKNSTLNLHATSGYRHESSSKIYMNVLTGTMDPHNSRDFRSDIMTNSISAAYRHGRRNNGFYSETEIGLRDIKSVRDERLGQVADWSKNYLRPIAKACLSYVKGENVFSLNYDESETIPTTYQLRNTIDDSNPLFLYSGNPELKLSVNRQLELSWGRSFAEKNNSMTISAGGSILSNPIITKTSYYTEATWLDQFDYMAPAGSSLMSPVNTSNSHNEHASLEYSRYFTRISSELKASISYNGSESPFYIADKLHINSTGSGIFALSFDRFSENSIYSLSTSIQSGTNRSDGSSLYDFTDLSLRCHLKRTIGEHLELETSYMIDRMLTTVEEAGYTNSLLSISAGWRFGKEGNYIIRAFGNNLTDPGHNRSNAIVDDRMVFDKTIHLGRCAGLGFTYLLNRR